MHPGGNAKGREGGKVSFSCGCASYSHLSHSFQGDTPIFVGQETHTEGESSGNCKSVTIRTQREPGITLEAAQLEDGVTWGQHTQCGCFGDLKEAVTAF